MLYFLIWKALKSYRYLYIRYFISSGIIIRGKRDWSSGGCGIAAPGRALLWPLPAKHREFSPPWLFLLSSIHSQSCISSFLFKWKLNTAITEHLCEISATVFRLPRPAFAVSRHFEGVLIR